TRCADAAAVMEHVLKGKGREIGFGPVTEILQHREKGLKLVGPLPSEVQNYTSYSAAPTTAAANAELARVFVRYLGSPEGKALFVAAGIDSERPTMKVVAALRECDIGRAAWA